MSMNGSCDIAALVFRSPLLPTAIIATPEIYLCHRHEREARNEV